jgi:hypothetical protein
MVILNRNLEKARKRRNNNALLVDDAPKDFPRGRDFNMSGASNDAYGDQCSNRLGRDHCIHCHECSEDE